MVNVADSCSRKGSKDGVTGEDRGVIDRDNKGTKKFAANVTDASSGGTSNHSRKVATFADVAGQNLKTKVGMITLDGLSNGVKAIEWIISNLQI
jgi:hypothetical protein